MLNYTIQILNENIARRFDLSMNKQYPVISADHEAHTIKHPINDERIEIPFKYTKEFRPKY